VILSKDNRKDIEDIKPDYIKGITFTYIEEMVEIEKLALLEEKVINPVNFNLDGNK
jgi:ATP-dependent Lon protease